ncbi:calphotin-like [Musca domestica]|uniref:Calphotin-like n=1 Tax=Musca domestica TaxID=7370 RepID=A0A9J7DF46_MUSDO|nr:calphotin-like [Musca domestica]
MFKFVTFFACISVALAAPGLVAEHHTVFQEPVLAKVGAVVHSVPSATSHQSFTRVHNKAVVAPVVTPVVKTTVHAAPVLSVVKTVEPVVPVVKTVAAAPIVKTVVPAVPVVKTVAPVVPVVGHAVSHQSHVQIHSNAAVVAPVVHTVPVVHAAPVAHVVHH